MRDRQDGDCDEILERTAPVRTPRLLMRRPGEADRAVIVHLAANPGIARNLAAAPDAHGDGHEYADQYTYEDADQYAHA